MSWYDVARFYAYDENVLEQKDLESEGDGRSLSSHSATNVSKLKALVDLDCPYVRYGKIDTISLASSVGKMHVNFARELVSTTRLRSYTSSCACPGMP
jgi:hypothetical protein